MPWTRIEARLREAYAAPIFDRVRELIQPLAAPSLLAAPKLDLDRLKRIKADLDPELVQEQRFERALLIEAALASTRWVDSLRLPSEVKQLLEDRFLTILDSGDAFNLDHPWFPAWSRIITLRRFPAGQFDFEYDGLPRSYLLKARPRDWPKLALCFASSLRGFRPYFMTHMAVMKKKRNLVLHAEAETNRSYYRVARALQLQPEVRGLISASWFYSPDTFRASPHLAWLNRTPSENGALITTIGPASPDSGVFERSAERKKLYDEGKFHPTTGLLIWPRRQLIAWAERYGEPGAA
jgi:hypothetical protein